VCLVQGSYQHASDAITIVLDADDDPRPNRIAVKGGSGGNT